MVTRLSPQLTPNGCCWSVLIWGILTSCLCEVLPPGIDTASRRTGAKQRPIVIFTSIIEPPFLFDDPAGRVNSRYRGFIPDLVARVGSRLRGYRYKLKLVTNGAYGVEDVFGNWNGMVGEVISGEAHVAAGAMSIRPSRQEVIDFTVPYMQSGITAVLKDTLQPSLDAVKTPLDLANQSAVSYGCIPGTQTYYYFRNSNGTIINRMWQQMTSADPSVFEMGSQLGIQRVRDSNGSYAFLLENLFAEYLSSQPPCELRVLNGFLNLSKYAFAVKKNSPLLHSLNEILRSLVDGGVVERLKKKWWRGECNVKVKPFKVDDASISVNLESRADEAQDGVEMNSQEKPQEIVWNTSGSNQCHQSLSWMVLLVSFLLVK